MSMSYRTILREDKNDQHNDIGFVSQIMGRMTIASVNLLTCSVCITKHLTSKNLFTTPEK